MSWEVFCDPARPLFLTCRGGQQHLKAVKSNHVERQRRHLASSIWSLDIESNDWIMDHTIFRSGAWQSGTNMCNYTTQHLALDRSATVQPAAALMENDSQPREMTHRMFSSKQLEELYLCPITQCIMQDPVLAMVSHHWNSFHDNRDDLTQTIPHKGFKRDLNLSRSTALQVCECCFHSPHSPNSPFSQISHFPCNRWQSGTTSSRF